MNKSSAEISAGQPVTASPYIANFFIKTSQLSLLGVMKVVVPVERAIS